MTTMIEGTQEYLERLITANVDLVAQSVSFSLDNGSTWLTGTWATEPSTQVKQAIDGVTVTRYKRVAHVLLGDGVNALPEVGEYLVLVRIVDVSETPIFAAGALEVVSA